MPQKPHYYEQVYEVTRSIPEGRVTTYGAIADFLALGSARMVGYALRNCKQMGQSDIPAHRVVNHKGELTGRHNWDPPQLMQSILESEGVDVSNDKVIAFSSKYWHPEEGLL